MASRAMKIDPKKPITTDLKAGQEVEETPNEAAIAARAYELWQERGCPIGSPETDWLRAEEELRSKPSVRPASNRRYDPVRRFSCPLRVQ